MALKNLYLISIFLLFANAINASESLSNERDYGDISGLLRFYYIFEPSYVKSGRANDYKIDGSVIGGHIGYISPTINNLGVATTLYYTQDTGLNETNDIDTMMAAGRFFTKDYSAKAILGELSLFYKDDNHHIILGRQKINSPLTNSIVTYMPNMFEALYYTNTQLDEFKFTLLHIDKMAYGTRTPVEFGLIGEATRTAGASQSALDSRGKFLSIEQQLLANTTVDTNGATGFALRNTSLKNTTINIWDFYAYDIINSLYLDVIYKNKYNNLDYALSGQYLNVRSVGKNLASAWLDNSSANLIGLKLSIDYENISAYVAYNHSGDGKILNIFGGDPAYTSSFFSRNAYRANVDAYKIGAVVRLKDNFKIIASYANYGKSSTMGSFVSSKPVEALSTPKTSAQESALLFSYNPIKSINILTGAIYKNSEYYYNNRQINLLDLDLLITYRF